MAERTSAERSIKRCFSLDAQKLSTVWDIVKENGKEPSIQYWCSDQTRIETEHLDRLINFPNTRLRSIYKIKLTNAYRPPLHVDVTFSNEPELEYHIDGDDDKVISVKNKLDELLLSATNIYPVF
jgi:hypothetical protein